MVAAILGASIELSLCLPAEPAELVPVCTVLQALKVPDLSLDIVLSCLEPGARRSCGRQPVPVVAAQHYRPKARAYPRPREEQKHPAKGAVRTRLPGMARHYGS